MEQTSLARHFLCQRSSFSHHFFILQVVYYYHNEMYLVTNVLDKPHWRAPTITYQEKETYFTAVLDLGDMFDGGGVPIDHYIIQLDTVGNSRPHSQF